MLFLCGLGLIIGSPLFAKKEQPKQVAVSAQELTPVEWDQHYFASLANEHKRDVIGILQATQTLLKNTYDSVDKGVDTFMKSYEQIVQFYGQIAMTFVPRADMCLSMSPIIKDLEIKLPMIKALEVLPSAQNIFDAITRYLPTDKTSMTEEDLNRALNKVFRNKESKAELRTILKTQCDAINGYVTYLNAKYAQEVAELEEFKAQMQAQIEEMISKMQAQQG